MSNTIKAQETKEDQDRISNAIKKAPLNQRPALLALFHHYQLKKSYDIQQEKEVLQIHLKYDQFSIPIFQATNEIVNGRPIADHEVTMIDEFITDKENNQKDEIFANQTPVSDYWLETFLNSEYLVNEIHEHDEPLLKHLKNLRIQNGQNLDFILYFEFEENPYFKNKILSKEFIFGEDQDFPQETKGVEIEWNEGKNVTKKIVKKHQKNKKNGQSRTIEKEQDQESFFNFFKSQKLCNESNERDSSDFEIAKQIQEEILPYSLEYYLGIKHGEDIDDDYEDSQSSDSKSEKQKSKAIKKDEQPGTTKEDCKTQ